MPAGSPTEPEETTADLRQRISALAEEYLTRLQMGEAPDRKAFISAHPEIAGPLERRLAVVEAIYLGGSSPIARIDPRPPAAAGETVDDAEAAERPDRVGPYRILDLLGEGGMGVVYLAEQTEPVRRLVALKLIKLGMDTREVVARFESERQALALMDHPGIAKVLGAGATEKGQPYFAMDYVAGMPLTEYCDRNRLTAHQRLFLFLDVCDAIQHAHQKGIIHRDLKPSNILVSTNGKPIPRVIDFGVAKATAQRLTERTVFTEHGRVIGTPEYMSPEQAAGTPLDIDTRTDIYSLGVILYELLTGAPPFDARQLRSAGLHEIQRRIREEEPPKPSTRVSTVGEDSTVVATCRGTDPRTLMRLIRGDLDWITMKALEKDRGRRHATVSDLAADVLRHLDSEPVLAGPPTAGYRMRKFLRRYRGSVAAVLAVAVTLVGGLAAATTMYFSADAARREAEAERESAEMARRAEADQRAEALREAENALKVREFLEDIFATLDPMETGNEVRVAEVLARAERDLATLDLSERPEIEGPIRRTLGKAYTSLADFEKAEPHLTSAVILLRHALGDGDQETLRARGELANLRMERGSLEEAEAMIRETLEDCRRVLGEDHHETLEMRGRLGLCLARQGYRDEAVKLLRDVVEAAHEVYGDGHKQSLSWASELADVLREQGRLVEAEKLTRQVLDARRRVLGERHPVTLLTRSRLARILGDQGSLEKAEDLLRQHLDDSREVFGEEHPRTVDCMAWLAICLAHQGRQDEAELLFHSAIEGRRRALGPEHPDTLRLVHHLAAIVRYFWSNYGEAEELLRKSLELCEDRLDPEDPRTLRTKSYLGDCLRQQGRHGEAERLLREASATQRSILGEDHEDTLVTMFVTAQLLWQQRKHAESLALHREVLERQIRTLGYEHATTRITLRRLGWTLQIEGGLAEIEPLLREGLDAQRRVLGEGHPDTVALMGLLAHSLQEGGREEEALRLQQEALEIARDSLGEAHEGTLDAMQQLARLLERQGERERAEEIYRQVLEIRTRLQDKEGREPLWAMESVAGSIFRQGRVDEAMEIHEQVLEATIRRFGEVHPVTITNLHNMGQLLFGLDRFAEAEDHFRRAYRAHHRMTGGEETPTSLVHKHNVASMLFFQGKFAEADAMLREVIRDSRRLTGGRVQAVLDNLNSLANLADATPDPATLAEAATVYREALEVQRREAGEDDELTIFLKTTLGSILRKQGKPAEAEALLPPTVCHTRAWVLFDLGRIEEAEKIFRQRLQEVTRPGREGHSDVLGRKESLALCLRAKGELAEAETLQRDALGGRRRIFGEGHPFTCISERILAGILHDRGKVTESEELYRKALEGHRETHGVDHRETIETMAGLANLLRDLGKLDEAARLGEEVVKTSKTALTEGHWQADESRSDLAATMIRLEQHERAESLLLDAHDGLKTSLGEDHAKTQEARRRLVTLYEAWKKPAKAKEYRDLLTRPRKAPPEE